MRPFVAQITPLDDDGFTSAWVAYDQAFKQLWPLMGFVLKTRQHEGW